MAGNEDKNGEYRKLDTTAFSDFLSQKNYFINTYQNISNRYRNIKDTLLQNWKGHGAEAFSRDAELIQQNIIGLAEILKTMCDTLQDCQSIFDQADSAIGEGNKNAQ